jgi:predicted DCC family thiol-disulfide oxidoreductase YuxK
MPSTTSVRPVHSLTVIYDEQCALCRRCRHWLEHERVYLPVHFLAAGSAVARERYRDLPWLGADLVVVTDTGDAWIGPAAFLVCLWATQDYRAWSYRMSGPTLAPLAERFFHLVSKQRGRIGRIVGDRDCPDGQCRHRDAGPVLAAGQRSTAETYTPPAMPWTPTLPPAAER